jgi:hypothetical protein
MAHMGHPFPPSLDDKECRILETNQNIWCYQVVTYQRMCVYDFGYFEIFCSNFKEFGLRPSSRPKDTKSQFFFFSKSIQTFLFFTSH